MRPRQARVLIVGNFWVWWRCTLYLWHSPNTIIWQKEGGNTMGDNLLLPFLQRCSCPSLLFLFVVAAPIVLAFVCVMLSQPAGNLEQ